MQPLNVRPLDRRLTGNVPSIDLSKDVEVPEFFWECETKVITQGMFSAITSHFTRSLFTVDAALLWICPRTLAFVLISGCPSPASVVSVQWVFVKFPSRLLSLFDFFLCFHSQFFPTTLNYYTQFSLFPPTFQFGWTYSTIQVWRVERHGLTYMHHETITM